MIKFTDLGRVFINPFPFLGEDYYKKVTYDEFFKVVKHYINREFYEKSLRIYNLKRVKDPDWVINKKPFEMSMEEYAEWRTPAVDLTEMLKVVVPFCPGLFESDSRTARILVKHFGRIVTTSIYGQSPKERQKAKADIAKMLERPRHLKGSKIYIPPFLSLNDMCAYIHRITNYLRDNAILLFRDHLNASTAKCLKTAFIINTIKNPEILKALQDKDKRFMEVIKKGYMGMLINKPKELTITLVANFLNLTPKGLKQQLKEERRHPNTCHLDW